jgi:hypothetical protein
MRLRKRNLDINPRLIIIFIPCTNEMYVFSFQNATSSVLLAVLLKRKIAGEGGVGS